MSALVVALFSDREPAPRRPRRSVPRAARGIQGGGADGLIRAAVGVCARVLRAAPEAPPPVSSETGGLFPRGRREADQRP
jgi:hypothetical protein